MNGEVNNNENKKKQKVAILIGVVTLLIAVLGATYAFFQISTDTNSSNTTITGSTPASGLVTLKGVTSNLHLNISASDMSLDNVNNEYYATDVEEKPYEDNEKDGTKTIAEVELSGGEATTTYSCTAKLTVSRVTEPESEEKEEADETEETKDMIEVLKPGDMFLQFKGNIISNILDLSMLKETDKIEYNLKFKVTGNKKEAIKAYIKLINKDEQQNYLAGSKLNIDIDTSDLKCNVFIPDPKIAELRADDEQGYLSEELQGGMYRYQASFPECDNESECENATKMTNWIVFGTDKNCEKNAENKCTNIDNMTYDDYIDKYMYRIIGITEYGEMYLLKETFLKEGETSTFFWNASSYVDQCIYDFCEWPNSYMYRRINGISNGNASSHGSNLFLGTNEHPSLYDYLTEGTEWYNLIEEHNWMYGDTNETKYNGNEMYGIETGNTITKRYWSDEESPFSCLSGSQCTEKKYTWSKSIPAKIGLMYMHDMLYACIGGSPDGDEDLKYSWIYFRKDGYNIDEWSEWLITRFGISDPNGSYVDGRELSVLGGLGNHYSIGTSNNIRPVFYLSSDVKIKEGTDGTKANPYILDVQFET